MADRRKLFGDGRAGYPRQADEWYVEAPPVVEALIANETFVGGIFDPACGIGTIPRTFARHGFEVGGADKVDRGYGAVQDYLTAAPHAHDNIVSNPPFAAGIVERFVLKAVAEAVHKVAFLLRLNFLEGMHRHALIFDRLPPARVLVSRRRWSIPPGDAEVRRQGGQMAFAWFIWQPGFRGDPAVRWI